MKSYRHLCHYDQYVRRTEKITGLDLAVGVLTGFVCGALIAVVLIA